MLMDRSCMCVVDLGKAFDRAPRNVLEWLMQKKEYHKFLLATLESV